MTKRGRQNRSDDPRQSWTDIPGLAALAILGPALALFCVGYAVIYAIVWGDVPW